MSCILYLVPHKGKSSSYPYPIRVVDAATHAHAAARVRARRLLVVDWHHPQELRYELQAQVQVTKMLVVVD